MMDPLQSRMGAWTQVDTHSGASMSTNFGTAGIHIVGRRDTVGMLQSRSMRTIELLITRGVTLEKDISVATSAEAARAGLRKEARR